MGGSSWGEGANYRKIGEVIDDVDGVQVSLRLNVRQVGGERPAQMVSWRTRYPGGGANRRFW